MWTVHKLDMVPVELDFSSSGQGIMPATAVYSDGIRLINALDLVEYKAKGTQVEICEGCGFSQCEPGGWVTFRRAGEVVIWIPAWSEMETGSWELNEFGPPSYIRHKGLPVFSAIAWGQLRDHCSTLPKLSEIPEINSLEAIRQIQVSAPGRILGEFPNPVKLRREFLLAVAQGEVSDEMEKVESALAQYLENSVGLELVPPSTQLEPIEFYLDLPGFPSWMPMAYADGDVVPLISREIAMRQAAC